MAKPPELPDETKLAATIKFPSATVGKLIYNILFSNQLPEIDYEVVFSCNKFRNMTLLLQVMATAAQILLHLTKSPYLVL